MKQFLKQYKLYFLFIMNKIYKDLNTFSKKDIQSLFSFYNVNSISDLIPKIYRKGFLPTIFDYIKNNDIDSIKKLIANSRI